jgi:hypothetical protein
MANSANIVATVLENTKLRGKIRQSRCVLTTANSDLVVHTPGNGSSVYLKGLFGCETSAANLAFKQRSASLTGTVATTSGSTTVTGTGTSFVTDYASLPPGAEIVIDAAGTPTAYTISSVTNNTTMVLSSAATSTVSGKTHARQETIITPELAGNEGFLERVRDGWILATKTSYALVLNTSLAISELLVQTQEGVS